jgi:tRNA nucleotidyltransferase (CCA-adding enzyme)
MQTKPPQQVIDLALACRQIGGRAMLVGGCVRDEMLGVEPAEHDIEVYGIQPVRLRELLDSFGPVDAVGEAFTVYKLGQGIDVTLPRREKKSGPGHKGFVIEGDPEMSFEEASRRRDFTVNAMLKDPLTEEVVDPFDGEADLKRNLLRAVSEETFPEDSLRVLRAAQFVSRYGFEIESATSELCRGIALDDLPKERIWGEMEKLLIRGEKPFLGLKAVYDLDIAKKIFPELQSLVGVPQEYDWHPEGNVDVHTMLVAQEARKLIDDLPHPKKVTVMLGAVCHDFGKPPTTEFRDGRIRSLAHDEAGVVPTEEFLDRLGIHTVGGYDVRSQVVALVRFHLKPGEFYKSKPGDGAFRRLARKVEADLLYRVAKADSLGRNADWVPREKWFGSEAQEWFIERVRELEVENSAPKPILMGRHLIEMGLEPSPRFKEIIEQVYELQLDGKISDLESALAQAKRIMQDAD